ncbi:glycine betaine ABC transporter substrate-binding protein [Conexibacter sp. SYSU D00693]|uniref:ABC transporter substrate-binding protein n=1 Tax=Conexibacter sp. SYSU D00693 TaxID=2812560 RepID=UPI00196A3B81|nr:glycine betaine ABC transporter substrate-binding protein [Conexibacter sp. SYSU D00693]
MEYDIAQTEGPNASPLRRISALACAGVLALGIGACGGDDGEDSGGSGGGAAGSGAIKHDAANTGKPVITIGSKDFTEEFILAEVYSQALQAAGFRVRTRLDVGAEQEALKAVERGDIDAYPEYTGTALTAFCGVEAEDVPKSETTAFSEARTCLARRQITALPTTPFTNSNGFAITKEEQEQLGGITKLSQLAGKASGLTLSGGDECRERDDCLKGLRETYGLRFKRFLEVPLSRRHEVLRSGQSDVGLVFTTDGQIKADSLVLLEDDRDMLPPYNVSLLVRDEALAAAGPGFERTVQLVQQGLTTEVMQELNSRVDLDDERPAEVARQYLVEAGYIADE